MATRGVAITIPFMAWDTSNNVGKTGDAANISQRWTKDGTIATLTTATVTELDATNAPGLYKVSISATEADCDIGVLHGKSSTANISIIPVTIQFERLPNAAPGANGGVPTVDANNRIVGIQGTNWNDFDDVYNGIGTAPTNWSAMQITAGGVVSADSISISGDSAAADNLELFFDGTGYNAANSTIGTCTTNTDMRGTDSALLASSAPTNWSTMAITVGGVVSADAVTISGDATAADNLELFFDGTGYAASNSTIGTCTTNTDMRGTDNALLAASAPTNFGDLAITATTGRVTVGGVMGAALTETTSGRLAGNMSTFWGNADAATSKTVDDVGGGSGVTDWSATERNQIRFRLGLDGTATEPTANEGITVDVGSYLGTTITETNGGDVANNFSQFFDVNPTTTKTVDDVGGGAGTADWTTTEKNQIRYRIGIDGTTAVPTATPTLPVDATKISGDATAADNLELFFDGTGYNASTSTIGTCTTNTDMRGTNNALLAASAPTNFGAMQITGAGVIASDAISISGDSVAANNLEAFFDGTGYAAANSTVGTVTTLTGHTPQTANHTANISAILADTNELQTDNVPGLIAALNDLDAAGVRTAVGLAAANLDTQLADIPTVAELNARTLVAASYFDPTTDNVVVGGVLGGTLTESTAGRIAGNMSTFWDNADAATTQTVDDVGGGGGGTGNVTEILGTALTETNAGDLANSFSQLFDVNPTTAKTVNDIGTAGTTVSVSLPTHTFTIPSRTDGSNTAREILRKQLLEKLWVSCDFVNRITAGNSIASISSYTETEAGLVENGTYQAVGTKVMFWLLPNIGTVGDTVRIQWNVVDTLSQSHSGDLLVEIRST